MSLLFKDNFLKLPVCFSELLISNYDNTRFFQSEISSTLFRQFANDYFKPENMKKQSPPIILFAQMRDYRKILNLRQIVDNTKKLRTKLNSDYYVTDLQLESLATKQLSRLFSRTRIFVSVSGSSLLNMLWMPRGSTVIEILPPCLGFGKSNPRELSIYNHLADQSGHSYVSVVGGVCDAETLEEAKARKEDDFEVDVSLLESHISDVFMGQFHHV